MQVMLVGSLRLILLGSRLINSLNLKIFNSWYITFMMNRIIIGNFVENKIWQNVLLLHGACSLGFLYDLFATPMNCFLLSSCFKYEIAG